MTDQLAEIKARFDAIIPGPWRWYGNTATDQVVLATTDRGRLYILAPGRRTEEYVFDVDACESYTLADARERLTRWCPAHREDADEMTMGECQCDELREFMRETDAPEEQGYRSLGPLTRGAQVHTDLRFPDKSLGDRRKDHGGTMRSHRDDARYEVLGYRTKIEWEMDQGGVIPNASHDISEFLYREDFCGLDQPEATFIEHAPEDIGWLLGEVERLGALLDSMEGVLEPGWWRR